MPEVVVSAIRSCVFSFLFFLLLFGKFSVLKTRKKVFFSFFQLKSIFSRL